jgi:hypothetical protein
MTMMIVNTKPPLARRPDKCPGRDPLVVTQHDPVPRRLGHPEAEANVDSARPQSALRVLGQ